MPNTVTDIAPKLEVLTGSVLAPGNAIHVKGWFRKINAAGEMEQDNEGPIKAFLAAIDTATSAARPGLVAICTPAGVDGRWNISMSGQLLQLPILQGAFGAKKVAFLVIEQENGTRTHVKFSYSDSKAAVVK